MMKKSGFRIGITLLSIVVIFLFFLHFLCQNVDNLKKSLPSEKKIPISVDKNRNTYDRSDIVEQQNIYHLIKLELQSGSTFQEISISKEESLLFPEYIHIGQAVSYQSLGGLRFAIIQRRNMNISPERVPIDYPTVFSGVLANEEGKKTWETYVTVNNEVNDSGYLPINNVFSLWNEDELLYLTVVDSNGAGSGEGFLKAFVSDDYGKTWKVERCFYYTSVDVCKVEIYDKENGYGRYVCLHPREQMDILEEYPLSYGYCKNAFL